MDEAATPVNRDLASIHAALRVSEERLRQLVQAANDAVVSMDEAGMVVDWNARAEWMFGWTAKEAIGRRLSELIIPPAMREKHEHGRERFLATRNSRLIGRTVETSAVHRDGHEIPVELSLWPIDSGARLMFGAFIRDVSTRKAAEARLRQQEEKYRLVVDNVAEGIIIVKAGRIEFANPAAERMVGISLEQMRSVPFTQSVHPDDRALVADHYVRRLRGEAVEQHYAFRVVRPDSSVLWLELSAVAIAWDGEPATLSFITDITARKALEDEVKCTLAEREAILDHSIVGIAFLDRERRIRWVNRAIEQMFGVERSRVYGLSSELFYPGHDEFLATGALAAQALKDGRPFEIELQVKRSNGELFWAYLSGRALDASDLLQGTVWAFIDISQRKELELALRRTTSEQEAILQSTLIGISLVSDGRFQWVNRTLSELLGIEPGRLIGKSAEILFPNAEQWNRFLADVQQRLDSEGTYSGEHALLRGDGQAVWMQLQGTLLERSSGARGSLWTFVDVSERHRAEQEVRRALEKEKELGSLKSRFVSMTSHEFRTPLAGILSSVELLRHYGPRLPDEEKIELFDQIEASVGRMTRMLDNILLIGRNDAQTLRFNPGSINLASLCRELAEEARGSRNGGPNHPNLSLHYNGDEVPRVLDANLLRHILGNLLSNAIKYSPQGGDVSFRVDLDERQVRFEVADQGIGIPKEDQVRLFETFHRASNVGSIAGTGLGLAIVKQSVDLHGGSIAIDSAPGEGTRFTVTLPLGRMAE